MSEESLQIEYQLVAQKYRFVQGLRYAAFGAAATGFLGLLGVYQTSFPQVGGVLPTVPIPASSRLTIAGIIPIIGTVWSLGIWVAKQEMLRVKNMLVERGVTIEHALGIRGGMFQRLDDMISVFLDVPIYTITALMGMAVLWLWLFFSISM